LEEEKFVLTIQAKLKVNVNKLLNSALAVVIAACEIGCESSTSEGPSQGGAKSGGSSNGGSVSSGGATQSAGAFSVSGGTQSGGAKSADGGSGGAFSNGGTEPTGGGSENGGARSGGASGGAGAPSFGGGSGSSGGSGGSGGSGANCALPSTFKWTSGGPIASPKSGWVAIKDFTHVFFNNKHIVYMTTHDQSNWGSAMMTFDDWSAAATAKQTETSFGVAPTLFYFTPKQLWVLAYQWGTHKFSYRTSTDPTVASSWSAEASLYNTALPSGGTGPIDQTVICNTTKCFLYYAGDNGHVYKSSMAIGSFPGEFSAAQDSGIQGTSQNLFEAVQVYSVQGSNKYLMIVEAQGNARSFRAWTATDLEGPWTLLTDNFAIKSNVTFSTNWTNDISHGDLVRSSPNETFPIDPCNLQMIFQGRDPNAQVSDYGLLPYKLGLLTLAK
jgi:hypothetical protein